MTYFLVGFTDGQQLKLIPVTAGGHQVYGLLISAGMGYRNDATTGVAKNGQHATHIKIAKVSKPVKHANLGKTHKPVTHVVAKSSKVIAN